MYYPFFFGEKEDGGHPPAYNTHNLH